MEQNIRNAIEFLISGIGALFLALIILIPTGIDPVQAAQTIFIGSFRSVQHVASLMKYFTVFILTSLAVLIPYAARIFNIGGEGQLYMGALGAIWISVVFRENGNILLVFLTAIVFGAGWAGIAGILKAKFNAHESVTTIFLNAIALYIVSYAVGPDGPLRDTTQAWNRSWPLPKWGILEFYYGTAVALILLALTFYFLFRTKIGYVIRATGGNPLAAEYAHFSKEQVIIITMLIGGGIAGMAGAFVLSSIAPSLQLGISSDYGYLGIGAAAIVNFQTLMLIPSSLLFGMFFSGMKSLQISTGLSETIIPVLIGITVLISLLRENSKIRSGAERIIMVISQFLRRSQ